MLMPQGEVFFVHVRQILGEFLAARCKDFKSITPCPLGQAFVRMNSVTDRHWLVNNSPLPFDYAHIVFEKHDQGLNYKHFHLNGEVWLQLVAFSADLRSMCETGNAVSGFNKLLLWDRVKSFDGGVVMKVKVVELKDIPISVVVPGTGHYVGESWTCPIVLI